MKKRIIGLITIVSFIAVLCGCNKSAPQYSDSDSDNIGVESGTSGSTSSNTSGGDRLVFEDFVGEYPEHPLPIMTLSEEELRRVINEQPNFQCSENLYINIPESTSVYEFKTYGVVVPQRKLAYSNDQFKKDYEAAFKYFFPGKEMDMDYFKYFIDLGFDYEEWQPLFEEGFVKDTGTMPDGSVELIYDEMPERTEVWNSPVYMDFSYEIGVGNGIINKGEAAYLVGKQYMGGLMDEPVSSDTYNELSSFDLLKFYDSIGTYSPRSEISFNLLDGEMRICDAVEFFENYINKVPISDGLQRNLRTRVYSVDIMQLDRNTYGYYFKTQPEFQGVRYDLPIFGSIKMYGYEYDPRGGWAYMLRHDDVDCIIGFYGNDWTFEVKPCDAIVPVETAIKTISENLTEGVNFDLLSVEFVYAQQYEKDEKGHIIIDTYEAYVKPVWRISLGNANDDLTYLCYVDAKDGGNFVYYTVPGIRNFN